MIRYTVQSVEGRGANTRIETWATFADEVLAIEHQVRLDEMGVSTTVSAVAG